MNLRSTTRKAGPVLVVVGALGAVVAGAVWFIAARNQAMDDQLAVYCLAPGHRQNVVDAAVALGLGGSGARGDQLVVDGRVLDVPTWRDRWPGDFSRACSALSAAQLPPGPGILVTLLPFLTGVTGAVLAFAAASWRDRLSRGHTLADDLRKAFAGFRRSVEAYLDAWSGSRSGASVLDNRETLLWNLARAQAAHPRWTLTSRLETELTSGGFGDGLTRGWEGDDEQRAETLRSDLVRLQHDVLRVAAALEHPYRFRGAGAPR